MATRSGDWSAFQARVAISTLRQAQASACAFGWRRPKPSRRWQLTVLVLFIALTVVAIFRIHLASVSIRQNQPKVSANCDAKQPVLK